MFGYLIFGGLAGIQETWRHKGPGYIHYEESDGARRVPEAEYKRHKYMGHGILLALGAGLWIAVAKHYRDKEQGEPPAFPEWLEQQGSNISIQDALDEYIALYCHINQADDQADGELVEHLPKLRMEVALLEQLSKHLGELKSPECEDFLEATRLALESAEDLLQMKRGGRRVIEEAMRRVDMAPPVPESDSQDHQQTQ